jgi:hypothetical protein
MLGRINGVHDARIVRIDDGKKFQTQYNRLLMMYRRLVQAGPTRTMPSPQEQALLDRQQHVGFNEMSVEEQRRLQGEIDSLFGQIPAHLQDKARGLAGVN